MQPNPYTPQPEEPVTPQPSPASQPEQRMSIPSRIIQPLSSEADILASITPTSPPLTPTSSESTQSDSITAGQQESIANSEDGYAGSTLITEPLHRSAQDMTPNPPSSPLDSSPQNDGGKKVTSIVIGLITILALGIGSYYFYFSSKIAAANLVETTAQKTSYKYPKGWTAVPIGLGIETYSDVSENKTTVATVTVDEYGGITYNGNDRPDNWYDTLRSGVTSKESADSLRAFFRNKSKDCTSEITSSVEPDTKITNKTVGMATTTGTCTRSDGLDTVKRRTVVGEDDGIFRRITVAAPESDWLKSENTFQAMLDGIGQAS